MPCNGAQPAFLLKRVFGWGPQSPSNKHMHKEDGHNIFSNLYWIVTSILDQGCHLIKLTRGLCLRPLYESMEDTRALVSIGGVSGAVTFTIM